ncbi:MAG: YqeG family HAD IIIA-type phosphatase [Defluviitaleaceae bacterium]|nr:YqeG family HAD IIIA-type phosphatase [Defluviitaleaceae bacterium]
MFAPDYYYDSVFLIPYEDLLQKGITGLVFDIDNTLAPYGEDLPQAKIVALLNRLTAMGFQVCLLTNNTNKRLQSFNGNLQLYGIANAAKPMTRGLRQAMAKMRTTAENTAIIGDQLFTDVWAGKNARVTTILVKPLSDKDLPFVNAKRLLERFFLKKYFASIGKNHE